MIDGERKPIAKIEDFNPDSMINCPYQDDNYSCTFGIVKNVPYPPHAFGLALYAEADKELQKPLASAPIWEGYDGPYLAQDAAFTDEDPIGNQVKGKLTWKPARDEFRVGGYEVYMLFMDEKATVRYRVYVGHISKGGSTYRLDIPQTTADPGDKIIGFDIYSRSTLGGSLPFYATALTIKDDASGGMSSQTFSDNPSNIPVPASVKPIPAPIAPKAKPPVQIFVDGGKLAMPTAPFMYQGTTMVPFRPVFEKLGLTTEWDATNKRITGHNKELTIRLILGQSTATINSATKKLAVAPQMKNGATYVPLRFVGEATGRAVIWDGNLPAIYVIDGKTLGKLYYPSGTLRYEGQLNNGKMNGKGKLYREDGTLWYDAEFVNNEVTGLGSLYFGRSAVAGMPGQDMMIGGFLNGLPHGHCEYYYGDGSMSYDGEFDNGERTIGKQYKNGIMIYDGRWKNKMYDGHGKYYEHGFLYYEGEYAANAENGYGKYYDKAGYISAEGQSTDGQLNGHVNMYFPDGRLRFDGELKDGRITSGKYFYPDGTYFEGEYQESTPFQGKLFNPNGELVYEGKFAYGKPLRNKLYGPLQ